MELTWILIFLFAFCTMVFMALVFFLPEWVGISKPSQQERDAQAAALKENKPPK